MNRPETLRARWAALAPREKALSAAAATLVAIALAWFVLLGPALATLRHADTQRRSLDAGLQRMMSLQSQAKAMQSQPKQNADEAARQLEAAVRQRLGTTARLVIAGDRATLTLTNTPPDALAQWLTLARVNARAVPGEAHLTRNASGQWDGSLVVTLPPR